MTVRSPNDVLAETIDVEGLDVLDVGCGAGQLVRWMRGRGARAVGAECGADMRARALAADPDHTDDYVDAGGQDLPFDDRSFDLVVFSYSLHHVPIDEISAALTEARRVLRPGGTLYVVEPEPQDPSESVTYPVSDERTELAAARTALDKAVGQGFELHLRTTYVNENTFEDFESFADLIVGIDPERATLMEQHRDRIREQFHARGDRRDNGYVFRRDNNVTVLTAS